MVGLSQFGYRNRLTTHHHEMVEHSYIDHALYGLERLREGFVGARRTGGAVGTVVRQHHAGGSESQRTHHQPTAMG